LVFLESTSYCDFCPLEEAVKEGKINRASKKNEFTVFYNDISKKNNVDLLILTDSVELDSDNKKLIAYLKKLGVNNFAIAPAVGCRTFNYIFPNPIYSTYAACKCLNINAINPKVILTMGKALFHFTKSSVFDSWREFNEIVFNQTWFLPSFNSKYKIRIYPTAFIHDILKFDSFENLHFRTQIKNIKRYIENYEPIEIIKPIKKIVTDFKSFVEENKNKKYITLDTETNSLNCFIDGFKVGCITLTFDGITGYYIPIEIIDKQLLENFLSDKFLIWANGKYDSKSLDRIGIKNIKVDEDITVLFHLLNTERSSNSIKFLSWLIGFGGYEKELESYISKNKIQSYLDIPEKILTEYAITDVIVTFRLWQYAKKYLIPNQSNTYKLYQEIVIPVIPVLKKMEQEGILIDKEYLEKYHNELIKKKTILEEDIYILAGKRFNIGSNDDLAKVLESLKLKDYGRTKKGLYRTGVELLQKWEKDGYEIAEKLLKYRAVSKLDNTFVGTENNPITEDNFLCSYDDEDIKDSSQGLTKYIMSDNRIHGTIMPALTKSWRAKSYDPNLQNFLKHGVEGKAFRQIFIAPKDFLICEADYSGFQLRIVAMDAKEEKMIDIFLNHSGDIHSLTALNIFHKTMILEDFLKVKGIEPYKTDRYKSKTINFSLIFGKIIYSFRSVIEQEWSIQEIEDYILENNIELLKDNRGVSDIILTVADYIWHKYFETYPGLLPYMERCRNISKQNGYIESSFFKGGVRHLPELLSIGKDLSKERQKHYNNLFNIAVNTTIQTFEAIIVYKALVKIFNTIKENKLKSRLIATVHDSIVLYIHKSEIKQMYNIIKTNMETFEYEIPIVCEIEMGAIWGFGEEVNESNIQEFSKRYV